MDSGHLHGLHTLQGGAEAQPLLQSSLILSLAPSFDLKLDCRELSHWERSQAS